MRKKIDPGLIMFDEINKVTAYMLVMKYGFAREEGNIWKKGPSLMMFDEINKVIESMFVMRYGFAREEYLRDRS